MFRADLLCKHERVGFFGIVTALSAIQYIMECLEICLDAFHLQKGDNL